MLNYNEAERLISKSLNELMEHLMKNAGNSIHLKNIKNNLTSLKSIIDEGRVERALAIPKPQRVTKKTIQRGTTLKANKEDILKIAFALSKYDYNFFNYIFGTDLNQGEIFSMLAALFKIKTSTLRNYRDSFDHHITQVHSNRTGWVTEKLAPELQSVKDIYDNLSEEELTIQIKTILKDVNPDIYLLIKVAYSFLFVTKSVRTSLDISFNNHKIEVIVAAYPDRVAYMVFMGFDNILTKGIYPAIYVYRKFNKIFTVFGESETNLPSIPWNIDQSKYCKISDYFSDEELIEIRKYANTYLDNYAYKTYAMDMDAEDYDGYKLDFAQQIVTDLKYLLGEYLAQYQSS
jgi:hypothetical protein